MKVLTYIKIMPLVLVSLLIVFVVVPAIAGIEKLFTFLYKSVEPKAPKPKPKMKIDVDAVVKMQRKIRKQRAAKRKARGSK